MKAAIFFLAVVALASARTFEAGSRRGLSDSLSKIDKEIKKDIEIAKNALRDVAGRISGARKDFDEELKDTIIRAKDAVSKVVKKITSANEEVKQKIIDEITKEFDFIEKIVKMIEDFIKKIKEDFKENTSFECNGTKCVLCRKIPSNIIVDEDQESSNETVNACVGADFNTAEESVTVEVTVNDESYLNKTFTINDAEPLCVGYPRFPTVNGCVSPYGLDMEDDSKTICLQNLLRWSTKSIVNVNLNCFQLVNNTHLFIVKGKPQSVEGILKLDAAVLLPELEKEGKIQLF